MTGEQLYHLWCGSATSDRAHYFLSMNPADKEAWDRLASRVMLNEDGVNATNRIESKAEVRYPLATGALRHEVKR